MKVGSYKKYLTPSRNGQLQRRKSNTIVESCTKATTPRLGVNKQQSKVFNFDSTQNFECRNQCMDSKKNKLESKRKSCLKQSISTANQISFKSPSFLRNKEPESIINHKKIISNLLKLLDEPESEKYFLCI